MFNFVNELNQEAEKLEEQAMELQQEIQRHTGAGASENSFRKRLMQARPAPRPVTPCIAPAHAPRHAHARRSAAGAGGEGCRRRGALRGAGDQVHCRHEDHRVSEGVHPDAVRGDWLQHSRHARAAGQRGRHRLERAAVPGAHRAARLRDPAALPAPAQARRAHRRAGTRAPRVLRAVVAAQRHALTATPHARDTQEEPSESRVTSAQQVRRWRASGCTARAADARPRFTERHALGHGHRAALRGGGLRSVHGQLGGRGGRPAADARGAARAHAGQARARRQPQPPPRAPQVDTRHAVYVVRTHA